MHEDLILLAAKNLSDILRDAIRIRQDEHALIIFDTHAPLAQIITEGYRRAIPHGEFLDFDSVTPDDVQQRIIALKPHDLVVLVQSTNFRLNEFRLRIELFKRELKTIEHLHLERLPENQFETYINALAYDVNYYHPLGHGLKTQLDKAEQATVECAGTKLIYSGGFEDTKLNIGDYSQMKNVGGSFPIGEVFTEARDLTRVNGDALVFAFAGDDHRVRIVEPFRVTIENGLLSAPDAPQEFQNILELIKQDEDVLVRELGLGLNPAMGKHNLVKDITAFERQMGMHISLGAKHAVYKKPGLHRKKGRYHIDIFIDITKITADGTTIYQDGKFIV